jgi:hypothetical protein
MALRLREVLIAAAALAIGLAFLVWLAGQL